jgi:hypothetical protein
VTYKSGQYPVLEVTKKDGSTEELAIDSWKIDEIREFLQTNIETASGLSSEL